MIFFDHNATTTICKSALEKMREVLALPLNSSSVHAYGRLASKHADAARAAVKDLLNAHNYEVIFTSGATEGNNMILRGCSAEEIFASPLEHSSIANFGGKINEISLQENGEIDLKNLAEKIAGAKNSLICLTLANNETGAIQPTHEAAKIAHQNHAFFHCDLTQGIGKIDIDLEEINADFATLSGHKFGAAQGIGAVLIRSGCDLKPLIFGGGQEKSKRAGTLNIAGIASLEAACKNAQHRIAEMQKVENLRNFLEEKLSEIAQNNLIIFAQNAARLPNTSYFAARNCDAQTQLINFDLNKICVSSGSACSSGSVGLSKVLQAMKVEKEFLQGAIRVSLAPENTIEEIEKFIEIFHNFYQRNNK